MGCSNLTALQRLAKKWSGQPVDWPSLSENRQFTSIMDDVWHSGRAAACFILRRSTCTDSTTLAGHSDFDHGLCRVAYLGLNDIQESVAV